MRSASSRCRSSTGTGASDSTLESYNPFTNEITIHEDRVAASTLSLEHVQLHEQLPSMYELKEFNPSVSDATVYKHIQKLIDAGIVKEVALDDDQRRQGYPWKFYALTEEGQQFLQEHNLLAAEETLQQIYDTISDEPEKMVKYENAPRPDNE